ncbi:hypothetical protein LWI29_036192 [Acer saccharum]|uniref:Cytokinin riboside 5'-monophosphate phosphoribohydrolase n=1 Tax=Acer saccharum TaxID=4024 RepID=A0AA39VNG9_ACESA|nr:hypothetical protein LWI29_036192 [Acer saccharum]
MEETKSRFKRICVFCGSSSGKKSSYQEAAIELGKELITGETVGEVRAVSDMHQRKAEMARQADAFIALPGGYGTLEELLEVITWAQLGIHRKPVGLLNVDGYYNSLLSFVDKAVDEGFISPTARRIIISAPTAQQLVRQLEFTEIAIASKTILHFTSSSSKTVEIAEITINFQSSRSTFNRRQSPQSNNKRKIKAAMKMIEKN